MFGSHVLKPWGKTQPLTALSGCESEFYGSLKAPAEGLGMISILNDFGIKMRGLVFGDASAALGVTHRKGPGRTRHIDPGLLSLHETAARKRLEFKTALGAVTPADLLTQH